jgi:hypothetical protein
MNALPQRHISPARRLRELAAALVALATPLAAGATVSVTAGPAGATPVISTVADLVDVATYKVHTVRRNADGTTTDKTTAGLVAVPTLVDVDRSVVPLPDFTVTVMPIPTPSPRIRIDIQRVTLSKVPVLVEAVFDLPGGTQGVAFGYDGRSDTAPARFSTTVTFSRSVATDVNLTMSTSGAGTTLGIVGSLFTRGPGEARVEPTDVGVGLTPVPASLTARALVDPAAGRTQADLTAPQPTLTDVTLSDRRAGGDLGVTATIDRLPSSLSLDIAGTPGTDHQELRYAASAPIASIVAAFHHQQGTEQTLVDARVKDLPPGFVLTADTPPGGVQTATWSAEGRLGSLGMNIRRIAGAAVTSQVVANATDVPPALSFTKDGTRVHFGAESPVGSLEAGLASPGPVLLAADEPASYLKVTDTSSAARVLGLQSFTADTGDPVTLSAVLAPGPLHADITRGDLHVDAVLDRLPATLTTLSFSAKQGVVEYRASDPIDRIAVDVTSPEPIAGRATRAKLTLRGIPKDLLLDFGNKNPRSAVSTRRVCEIGEDLPDCTPVPGDGDGGGGDGGDDDGGEGQFPDTSFRQRVLLDANGGSMGSAEILLTSGPEAPGTPLTAAQDGVVVDDLADRFVVQARITGLQFAFVDLLTDDKRNRSGANFLSTHHTAELVVDPTVNGGRAVVVDHRRQQGLTATGEVDRFHAFVTNLPQTVSVDFSHFERVFVSPQPKITRATWTASSPITRVTVDADVPGLPNPVFLALDNVPTLAVLCKASNNACGNQPADDHGSFSFSASEPVRLSAFICQTPGPPACTHDDPSAMTDGVILRDVTVKDLVFELHFGDLTVEDPFRLRFDTKNQPITGNVVLLGGSTIDVNFPGPWLIDPKQPGGIHVSGFWAGPLQADDFRVVFDAQVFQGPLFPSVKGGIQVTEGTCIQAHKVPLFGTVNLIGCT